jgi:eukaryotic-like serine/threonine-protein kinase
MSTGGDARGPIAGTELQPGALINGIYRLTRLLGVGGMGEVWAARHERTTGRVALKMLLPEMGRHEQILLRFQREVEITSRLNHPNIVRVSDADKLPNGRPFLVMEYLEGHDLSSVSRLGQPLELSQAVEIVEQVALGLQAAHAQSIIHRDLKPANVFVVSLAGTDRMLVKILDFGISKALDGLGQLTQSRSVMGTPNYMAPEQATGGASSVDARADQFSLAAIAYELLTGRLAFPGDGLVNVIFKVVNEPPPSFASLGIFPGAAIEQTVMRGLMKFPQDRFGSVMEFSEAFRRAAAMVDTRGPAQRPVPPLAARTLPLAVPGAPQTTPLLSTLRSSAAQIAAVSADSWAAAVPRKRAKPIGRVVLAIGATTALVLVGAKLLWAPGPRMVTPRADLPVDLPAGAPAGPSPSRRAERGVAIDPEDVAPGPEPHRDAPLVAPPARAVHQSTSVDETPAPVRPSNKKRATTGHHARATTSKSPVPKSKDGANPPNPMNDDL